MLKQNVRKFFEDSLGIVIEEKKLSTKSDSVILNQKSLEKVLSIYLVWKDYIPQERISQFITELLNSLIELHCCAVSSLPGSPVYLSKIIKVAPAQQLQKKELYTSYHLGGSKIQTIPIPAPSIICY